MTNELDALLQALEPEAAGDLPKGWRWGKLADMAIGPPIAQMKMVRSGNKLVSVPTPESLKLAKAAATIKWPVLDYRNAPDEALAIWQAHAVDVQRYQAEITPKTSATAAAPAGDISSRPIVVRR